MSCKIIQFFFLLTIIITYVCSKLSLKINRILVDLIKFSVLKKANPQQLFSDID